MPSSELQRRSAYFVLFAAFLILILIVFPFLEAHVDAAAPIEGKCLEVEGADGSRLESALRVARSRDDACLADRDGHEAIARHADDVRSL